jgi:hypothetical protein
MRSKALRLPGSVIVATALAAFPASAATIDVKHTTLEKLLTDPARQDGRKYIAGEPDGPCGGVYVRNPRVRTAGALLTLEASLAGGFDLGSGICLPLPEDFQVILSAAPAYSQGLLYLRDPDLQIQGTSLGVFARPLLQGLLDAARLDVRAKLMELVNGHPSPEGVSFELTGFQVGKLSLLADRLRLEVGFSMEVQ